MAVALNRIALSLAVAILISFAGKGSEFLAFTRGQEEYAIDILKVQGIRGYDAVTRIANAPEFVKGVVNLRGIIVPIADMRIKFNLGTPTYDELTVVLRRATLRPRREDARVWRIGSPYP
jgi:purine-binding chemotaxis protein CheW